jgi:hypothetical protein
VRVGGAMMRWLSGLGPVMFGGFGMAAVADSDGGIALHHNGSRGRRMAAQIRRTPSCGGAYRVGRRQQHFGQNRLGDDEI